MKLENIPFFVTDWSEIQPTEHSGLSGTAFWRTLEIGDVRIRMVEYTPGYVTDQWCTRGHILLVLEGELSTELEDGRVFVSPAGTSFQVGTNAEPHRSSTLTGAKFFIVD